MRRGGGIEQLERVLVDCSAILLGNSEEAVTLGGDEVQPVPGLLNDTCDMKSMKVLGLDVVWRRH